MSWELAPWETGESLPIHLIVTTIEAKFAIPGLTYPFPVMTMGQVPEKELQDFGYSQSI